MKERPITSTAESVRAIIAGTKTMTRRALKQQPDEGDDLHKRIVAFVQQAREAKGDAK